MHRRFVEATLEQSVPEPKIEVVSGGFPVIATKSSQENSFGGALLRTLILIVAGLVESRRSRNKMGGSGYPKPHLRKGA